MNAERIESATGSSLGWDELASMPRDLDNNVLNDNEKSPTDATSEVLSYLELKELNQSQVLDVIDLCDKLVDISARVQNKFYLHDMLDDNIREIADHPGETAAKDTITPERAEANKIFSAILIDRMNRNPNEAWKLYESFFSLSPSPLSYVGGLQGTMELLTIAERSENNPCARALYDEAVYNASFRDANQFNQLIQKASPTKQLQFVPILHEIALRCEPDSWNAPALNKVHEVLDLLTNDPKSTPLVKIVADSCANDVDGIINSDWVMIDPEDEQYSELMENHKRSQEAFRAEQRELHNDYPMAPEKEVLTKIAPGIVGGFSKSIRVNNLYGRDGEYISLFNVHDDNAFGISRADAELLAAAHNPDVCKIINQQLGMDISSISLSAQIQLLKFMTEAGNERFDKLRHGLAHVDADSRLKLAESFLAADFGDDFGDALLDIAESDKISDEQLGEILDNVDSCRKSIGRIANLYTGDQDGEFGKEYARAANERLTDAIIAFRDISRTGEVEAELGWFGEAKLDYDSAMEALKYEARSLEIISGTMNDVREGKSGAFAEKILTPDEFHTRTMYNFYSPEHGYVLLYTRPEGSHSFESMLEYGKVRSRYSDTSNNGGVEASISFIVNPVDPFSLPNPFRPDRNKTRDVEYYDSGTMDKVSAIRIDREGRAPGAAADDPNRDPISEAGTVSVDLAAINDRMDTPSGKIARLFSIGNKIRNTNNGNFSLNHNTNWFNQDRYGTASGFKNLVDYLDGQMSELCAKYPPDKKEGFAGARRELLRRRGRMIRRVAS